MEEMIVLEVLEKGGKVKERVRLTSFPVSIGRAYDNDIILDDEYVSPHHLVVGRNESGALCVNDAQSENGLYQMPGHRHVPVIPVESESQFVVGATHLRIRRPDFAVAPTLVADRRQQSVRTVLQRGWVFVGLLVAIAAVLYVENYDHAYQKLKYSKLIFDATMGVIAVLLWPAIWAFVGRLLGRRTSYLTHANMFIIAILAYEGFDYVDDYYSFSMSAESSASVMGALAAILVGGLLLFGHLRVATHLRRKTVAVTSCLLVGGILGVTLLSLYVDDAQFSNRLSFPSVLKPLSSVVSRPLSPEAFLGEMQPVKQKLEKLRQEDN